MPDTFEGRQAIIDKCVLEMREAQARVAVQKQRQMQFDLAMQTFHLQYQVWVWTELAPLIYRGMFDPTLCNPGSASSGATQDRTGEPLDSCQHDLQLPECTVKVTDKGTRATCSECREVWLMPAQDRKGEP